MGETEDYTEDIALIAHATTHKSGGADEIDISGLTPMLHALTHKLGGSDEIDISGLIFKSCCHAYLDTAQNIPRLTVTIVNLDTVTIDRNSDFNTSTHKFICPVDGVYLVYANAEFAQAAADKWAYCRIHKNDALVAEGVSHMSVSARMSANAMALLACATWDEIDMRISQNQVGDLAMQLDPRATSLIVLSLYET